MNNFFFFGDGVLLLLPRLECSGVISAHRNLCLLVQVIVSPQYPQEAGITGVCHCAWLIFVFLVETGFQRLGQAGLELDLVSHHAWLDCLFIIEFWIQVPYQIYNLQIFCPILLVFFQFLDGVVCSIEI